LAKQAQLTTSFPSTELAPTILYFNYFDTSSFLTLSPSTKVICYPPPLTPNRRMIRPMLPLSLSLLPLHILPILLFCDPGTHDITGIPHLFLRYDMSFRVFGGVLDLFVEIDVSVPRGLLELFPYVLVAPHVLLGGRLVLVAWLDVKLLSRIVIGESGMRVEGKRRRVYRVVSIVGWEVSSLRRNEYVMIAWKVALVEIE
jgi:hypothetical protein